MLQRRIAVVDGRDLPPGDGSAPGLQMVEDTPRTRSYRTRPHKMGLKAGRNLDNIQALLSQIEGEDHR